MQYAVIKTGGKQYKVKEGDILEVARLGATDGEVSFDEVLLVANNGKVTVGTPLVPNMKVTAKVLGEVKGDKVRVAKFKAKVRFRRVTGFRALLTRVQVASIGNEKKAEEKAEVAHSTSSGQSKETKKRTVTPKKVKAQNA